MQLTDLLKNLLMETARELQGAARRRFMAKTVQKRGPLGTISSLHRTLMEST
jgi:hypothetical protein